MSAQAHDLHCPLCYHFHVTLFWQDKQRCYVRCAQCCLIFVPARYWLDATAEQAQYDLHINADHDQGYRRFLSRVAVPLQARLAKGSQGLDFGCGPGPILASMLAASGFAMALYDPYYAPNRQVLSQQYDFVCCTEAIEHFYHPGKEWSLLLSLLKPGAWLAIMTKLALDKAAFSRWHYKQDPTHVSFFSRETFTWLATRDGLTVEFIGNDVIMLQKSESTT